MVVSLSQPPDLTQLAKARVRALRARQDISTPVAARDPHDFPHAYPLEGDPLHPQHYIADDTQTVDEFDVILKQWTESGTVDGHPVSDLDQHILMREARRGAAEKVSPPSATNPRSVFQAVLGGSKTVISGGQPESVVWWFGEMEEATTVTVTLVALSVGGNQYPTAQDGSGNPYSYRPYANVGWGARGVLTSAQIDCGVGTQLTVTGSMITVSVLMDAAQAGYVAGKMTLTAMLGFGARNTTVNVTRTTHIDGLGAGGTKNIVVPPFAASFYLLQSSATNKVTINAKDTNGAIVYTFVLASGTTNSGTLPLSVDVYSIDIVTTNGGVTMRLIFNLCL